MLILPQKNRKAPIGPSGSLFNHIIRLILGASKLPAPLPPNMNQNILRRAIPSQIAGVHFRTGRAGGTRRCDAVVSCTMDEIRHSRCRWRGRFGWLWGISSALILFFHADELSALIFGNENAAQAIQWMSFVPIDAGIRELFVHHQHICAPTIFINHDFDKPNQRCGPDLLYISCRQAGGSVCHGHVRSG